MLFIGLLVIGFCWSLDGAAIHQPRISALSPKGIRFEVNHIPGATLMAFHYSVNQNLRGVAAGRWNYDVRSKSGNVWVHENRNVRLNNGDRVYYWIYAVVNRLGVQLTDQSWTVTGAGSGSSPVVAPVNPVKPQSSGSGSSSGSDSGSGSGRPQVAGNLRLVMEDTFDRLDLSKWTQEVTLGGGGNWEFQAYTPDSRNTYCRDGKLFLKPTLTSDKYGERFITTGKWDMKSEFGTCTESNWYGCSREGSSTNYLNPVMSGKLMSKSAIRYGKVEVIAKLPRGDWIWPAIWMLPQEWKYGGWPRSGEIDIMESRGNRKFGNLGVEHIGTTLHWGTEHVNRYSMTTKSMKAPSQTWADGLHNFTLNWLPSGMKFYADGRLIVHFPTPSQSFFRWGNLPGANIWASGAPSAPFDQKFYLILNVAVGGTNSFFPDGVSNQGYPKPWSNQASDGPRQFYRAKSKWYPTWKGEDAAMQVDSVRMWELV